MGANRKGLKPEELGRLREAMESGTIESLEEIRAWIEKECGVSYTTRGVAKLVERELGAKRVWNFDAYNASAISVATKPDVNALIDFINHFRVIGNISEDLDSLKKSLLPLLENVDRVSVYVSIADTVPQELYQSIIIDQGVTIHDDNPANRSEAGRPKNYGSKILKHLISQNAPLHRYHAPAIIEYHSDNGWYLGTIFLWQESSERVRSLDNALEFMRRIDQFIRHALYLLRSRYETANSFNIDFHNGMDNLIALRRLSHRELKVITFRVLGFSYEEIAKKLSISRSTVHKHIISIHKKTETSSIAEIFAKYFTPRFSRGNHKASEQNE